MKNTKKNIIPVIAVLVLIVIIILFMLLGRLIEKYTPSKEHQELSEYYGLASDDSVALIFNNEVLSVQGRLIDGNVYLDFETVHDKINSRFFWDANENKLLYTTATDLISADAESTTYYVTKDARTLDHTIVKADASVILCSTKRSTIGTLPLQLCPMKCKLYSNMILPLKPEYSTVL